MNISNFNILMLKFKSFTSEAAVRPQIFPNFISGMIYFASNRGSFTLFFVPGRTYPTKREECVIELSTL